MTSTPPRTRWPAALPTLWLPAPPRLCTPAVSPQTSELTAALPGHLIIPSRLSQAAACHRHLDATTPTEPCPHLSTPSGHQTEHTEPTCPTSPPSVIRAAPL